MSDRAAQGRAWLLLGAALGVGVAVRGVARCGGHAPTLPADAVALVGDSFVSRQALDDEVAADTEGEPQRRGDPAVRRRALERLVDDSLLVQAAIALGLPTRDPKLREDLAAAMRENITGEAVGQPADEVLRAYEEAHPAPYAGDASDGRPAASPDEVRASALAAWKREDDARRLRRWLDQRRRETRVIVREGPP